MRSESMRMTREEFWKNYWESLFPQRLSGVPYPIEESRWPIWAKAFRRFSTSEDNGIGDTIKRLVGDENSDAFKTWYKKITGKNCGCTGRQKRWNVMYPLKEVKTMAEDTEDPKPTPPPPPRN